MRRQPLQKPTWFDITRALRTGCYLTLKTGRWRYRAPGVSPASFQKHAERTAMPGLTAHDRDLWPNHPPLLTIDTADALLCAAQMNAVEFHTWNSLIHRLDKPDRVVFDLDPGEGVKWAHLQEAAVLVRMLLSELGLKAWLKTSGGKGLHVVVPLTARLSYGSVKLLNYSRRGSSDTLPKRFLSAFPGIRTCEPVRQGLRRLPAQWEGTDDRGGIFGPRPTRDGRFDAGCVGATC